MHTYIYMGTPWYIYELLDLFVVLKNLNILMNLHLLFTHPHAHHSLELNPLVVPSLFLHSDQNNMHIWISMHHDFVLGPWPRPPHDPPHQDKSFARECPVVCVGSHPQEPKPAAKAFSALCLCAVHKTHSSKIFELTNTFAHNEQQIKPQHNAT